MAGSWEIVSGGCPFFWMPHSILHLIVHCVTEETVAIHKKVIHLAKPADKLAVITLGFAGLAKHQAFSKADGAIDGCHVSIKPAAALIVTATSIES